MIEQSRTTAAWALFFAIAFVMYGEAYRTETWVLHSRRWPFSSVSFGYFALTAGLSVTAISLMTLLRPSRLLLAPSGLTYERPWGQEHWSWEELGEFVIERSEKIRVIRVAAKVREQGPLQALNKERRKTIPGDWRIHIVQVRDELNAARERWS